MPAAADAPRSPPQYAQFLADTPTIKDNFTLLEWDRRSILSGIGHGATFSAATSTVCPPMTSFKKDPSNMSPGRLPSLKELLTILDEAPHDEYEFGAVVPKMIDQLAFADTPVDLPYWSSTPAGGVGSGMVWTLSFRTGEMKALATTGDTANVRCVR
jgi:hypothetical protein